MNAATFRRKAERLFLRGNPTATVDGWTFTSRPFTGADGRTWRNGRFTASAPGHRTRTMQASACVTTGEMSVR